MDELMAEVASLPIEERATVADCILRTLNPPESGIDKKRAAVAKRRLAEIDSDQVQVVPGEQVFAKLWKRFGV